MTYRAALLVGLAIIVGIGALHAISSQQQKPPASTATKNTPQNECAVAATVDYNNANLALLQPGLQNPDLLMSVEREISKRRLQEQFCQRFAKCLIDPNNQSFDLLYGAAFHSCLPVLDVFDVARARGLHQHAPSNGARP